jgi:DNA-binding MarR family transcriptional regulator
MLYDAGADVGNMAKRMHQMFGDISGTFNAKTGETEFSWYENRMLAARAQAMGMDPGEVKNMIRQSNKQGVIDRALKGFKLDEETRTAIGNRATYDKKTGEWMVDTMNGPKTIKEVANMTDDERSKVLFPTEEGEAIIDIMKNVRSIKEREEANKLEGYSKSQISLFDAVTAASQKNIEAQNTIINNNNDFIETAKQRLADISNNAVTEARATVEFFEKNKDLIVMQQKFVEASIKH